MTKFPVHFKQIMALLALLGILLGVVGTAFFVPTSTPTPQDQSISQ